MFEATIFQYEDQFSIGTFETEAQAYEVLGRWLAKHGDIQFPHPHVEEV